MPRHILIVEDDRTLSSLMAGALRRQGWSVERAYTCDEARVLAKADPPELVVLDLGLPDGDGLALLTELRTGPVAPHVPVVVTSSRSVSRTELRQRLVENFISKPFDMQHFIATVQALLGKSGPRTWKE